MGATIINVCCSFVTRIRQRNEPPRSKVYEVASTVFGCYFIWGLFSKVNYWLGDVCLCDSREFSHSRRIQITCAQHNTTQSHTKISVMMLLKIFVVVVCFCSLFSFLGQMSNFVSYTIPHDAGKNTIHLYTHANVNFDSLFYSSLLVRGQILSVFFFLCFASRNLSFSQSLVIFKNLCLREMCVSCVRTLLFSLRTFIYVCVCERMCVCVRARLLMFFFYPFVSFTLVRVMQTHSYRYMWM